LTTKEIFSADYELIGLSLVIDGYEIGIQAWYVDYAKWLEEKYERTSKLLDAWLTTDNGVVSLTT
jgi:hypothetical protein